MLYVQCHTNVSLLRERCCKINLSYPYTSNISVVFGIFNMILVPVNFFLFFGVMSVMLETRVALLNLDMIGYMRKGLSPMNDETASPDANMMTMIAFVRTYL